MSSYKPADSKKEEFRKYLEKAGVLDALTKSLVCLYEEPEKPNNALDFLKKNLSKCRRPSGFLPNNAPALTAICR